MARLSGLARGNASVALIFREVWREASAESLIEGQTPGNGGDFSGFDER